MAQSGSALGWGPSGRRFKSGRPDFRAGGAREREMLDTIIMLMGITGFMTVIAAVFFGGFLVMDYIWDRLGGDP